MPVKEKSILLVKQTGATSPKLLQATDPHCPARRQADISQSALAALAGEAPLKVRSRSRFVVRDVEFLFWRRDRLHAQRDRAMT
jgi:hypothetical protein